MRTNGSGLYEITISRLHRLLSLALICSSQKEIADFYIGMAKTSMQCQSAKCYSSEASRFQQQSGYEFLQQLSPVRGSTALDLGCGTGCLAAQLSEYVGPEGKVVAVDPDGERLKIAQEKYARNNIDYVNGSDATFPEGPHDLVFANHVIHWVADKDALFRRVYQNLKPGGRFAFTTPNGVHVFPPVAKNCVRELFGPKIIGNLCRKRMLFLTCGQYQELAVAHGFVITSAEDKYVSSIPTGSVNDLINFFFGLLHGDLDREAISEQAIENCRVKYGDDLRREAELRQTEKILHVILTKPRKSVS